MPELSKIMYVEDEPDIQTIAKLSLETVGGYSVKICGSGQEAITNARRHARHATRVAVRVVGSANDVQLTVTDDGDPPPYTGTGYGLVGMTERAKLLGGTCLAGPGPERGWVIEATLPRTGGVS